MTDRLKSGLAWLTTKMKAHASTEVIIGRGAMTATVQATLGQKLLKLDDGLGGVRLEYTDLDALITGLDYSFGDGAVEPKRGDTLTVTVGTDTQTFEALPYGNEPAWRWADPHQSLLRIHYKRIGNPVL